MQVAFNQLAAFGEALRKYQLDSAKSDYDKSQESFGDFRLISIASILAGLAAASSPGCRCVVRSGVRSKKRLRNSMPLP
ncbi:MAG: methyl-accepting chemotaxis protein serine sensor receptor, partial [Caballeronia sp.]|nr:methyl-accepting chemotaxis protein serine sensor receptor [Caballeronia sp.]